MKTKTVLSIIACIMIISTVNAQNTRSMDMNKVKTLDSTISSLYGVVSGEKTQVRDWELLKFLCKDDAKLIPYQVSANGDRILTYMSVDEYIDRASGYFSKTDFFEKETHRSVDTFGPITQVFSTYESYNSKTAKTPFVRGINSIQLLNDGNRWWIINIYWTSESEEHPIPAKYLPKN